MPRARTLETPASRLRKLKPELSRQRADATRTAFLALLAIHALPVAQPEYRFDPDRKWRFDYAWPEHKVALEVEGGVWTKGRHSRALGFVADLEKYNRAAVLGWRIVRCVPDTAKKNAETPTLTSAIIRTTLEAMITTRHVRSPYASCRPS